MNVDEPPQIDHLKVRLTSGLSLVTLSFGGNDMGFARIVMDCTITGIYRHAAALLDKASFNKFVAETASTLGKELSAADALAVPCSTREIPFVRSSLRLVPALLIRGYREVADAAPRAKVLVVGYPNFFPLQWKDDYCLNVITRDDAIWTATQIATFDRVLQKAVAAAGRPNLIYVAPSADFGPHTICDTNTWFIQPEPWHVLSTKMTASILNSLVGGLLGGAFLRALKTFIEPNTSTSLFFHPNAQGQQSLANSVLAAVR